MNLPKYAVLQKPRDGKRTYGITPRIPGGFISADKMIHLSQVAKKYNGTIKITSGQRIAILGLQPEDVDAVWEELDMEPAVLSHYSIKNVEICPAAFCKRQRQNSLPLGMRMEKRYYGAPAPNRCKIGVVGCRNGCASVNAKDIGVLAEEAGYIVVAGGSAGFHPRLPDTIADKLTEEEAYNMVEAVYDYYCEGADQGEKLGFFIDRVTIEVFKEEVIKLFNNKMEEMKDE
jgi:NAD(P)H-nitrite reductase large subunit